MSQTFQDPGWRPRASREDRGPRFLTRRVSWFLLAFGAWSWFVWITFVKNLWKDSSGLAFDDAGDPTGYFWVHLLLAVTSFVLGTTIGIIGWRGLRGRATGPATHGAPETTEPAETTQPAETTEPAATAGTGDVAAVRAAEAAGTAERPEPEKTTTETGAGRGAGTSDEAAGAARTDAGRHTETPGVRR